MKYSEIIHEQITNELLKIINNWSIHFSLVHLCYSELFVCRLPLNYQNKNEYLLSNEQYKWNVLILLSIS